MRFKFLAKLLSGVLTLCLMGQNLTYAKVDTFLSDSAQKLILSKSYETNDKNQICTIKNNGKIENQYFYDDNDRLIKENNLLKNETIDYIYDLKGNIVSKKIYDYSNSDIPKQIFKCNYDRDNKITSYNENEILYDESGNISKYKNGLTFEWKNGKISGVGGANTNIEYTYDSNNNRISKSVNGLVTNFCFTNQKIYQSIGGKILEWYLPGNNINKSFNYEGNDYTYVCDLQYNVIAIADKSGKLVANYTYDTWGKILSITDENGSDVTNDPMHIGNINPIRYRGYYYDSETGFYYLNSRYYDPETGRFLSEDDKEYLKINNIDVSENLYTYCMNNPVNMSDYDGHNAVTLTMLMGIGAPEVVVLAAAVSALVVPMLFTNPGLKRVVDEAINWAVRTFTESGDAVAVRFKQLNRALCNAIANLAKGYNIYLAKQKIPSSMKKPNGNVSIPNTDPNDWEKLKKGEGYKHKRTNWKAKKGAPHGGEHWDVSPPDGRGHADISPEGKIIRGFRY